jgi:ceramide glucosyltransferase
MDEIEAEERVALVFDAAIHVHAAILAGVALNRRGHVHNLSLALVGGALELSPGVCQDADRRCCDSIPGSLADRRTQGLLPPRRLDFLAGASYRPWPATPDARQTKDTRAFASRRYGRLESQRMLTVNSLLLASAIAGAAVIYALVANWRTRAFAKIASPEETFAPPVTLLKPLCGAEPQLYENLRSFFTLDYPDYQIVLGARDPADPACAVVARLRAEFPDRDVSLIVDRQVHGTNLKISNLINMVDTARHDIFVIVDSDIHVPKNYLMRVVAPLVRPEVGAVTCLYSARPAFPTLASRLACLQINDWFLPSVLVARSTGHVNFCMGSTIALSRSALASIGGLWALRNILADDYTLGNALAQRGYQIALSSCVVETVVGETDFASVLQRELRWARTIRAVKPVAFAASCLTSTVSMSVLAALIMVLSGTDVSYALALVVVGLSSRLMLHYDMRRYLTVSEPAAWLVPLRDAMSFSVWAVSFFSRDVIWRNRHLSVDRHGNLLNRKQRADL